MNRADTRALMRKYKGKKYSLALIKQMAAGKGVIPETEPLKEGQKVKLNIERMQSGVNWVKMSDRYKEWVSAHADNTFTVEYDKQHSPRLVCLKECDAKENWLFWEGDLDVIDETPRTLVTLAMS